MYCTLSLKFLRISNWGFSPLWALWICLLCYVRHCDELGYSSVTYLWLPFHNVSGYRQLCRFLFDNTAVLFSIKCSIFLSLSFYIGGEVSLSTCSCGQENYYHYYWSHMILCHIHVLCCCFIVWTLKVIFSQEGAKYIHIFFTFSFLLFVKTGVDSSYM